ncbi:DUF2281 domain-containing protein [Thiocapsa sp.]|uniref:DUF2281 domain-containing protein n=1 Tax=Thiocapsa sp. TaxID=2024551 RepID=UPI0025FE39FC|nr:DUF2281 domain-containing protein [Thiocapsa sp.]
MPRDKQTEVFAFVDSLMTQLASRPNSATGEWSEKEFKDMSMQQAMRGMYEDPISYTDKDLKERWQ